MLGSNGQARTTDISAAEISLTGTLACSSCLCTYLKFECRGYKRRLYMYGNNGVCMSCTEVAMQKLHAARSESQQARAALPLCRQLLGHTCVCSLQLELRRCVWA